MSDNYYWEPTKAARVLAERGITLEEAQTVFEDELLDIAPDLAHSVYEARFTAIGTSKQGRLLVVTFTERGDTIRIITAREATTKERRHYETNHPVD